MSLENLTAKELKVIAKKAGLEFDKLASKEAMLSILSNAGILPDVDDSNAPEVTATEAIKIEAGDFKVITHITHNGLGYEPGSTITFDEVTDEVRSLVSDGVIK